MKRILLFLFTLIAFSSLVMLHSCIKPPDETQNCGDSPDEYYYLSAAQKLTSPQVFRRFELEFPGLFDAS